MQSRQTLEVKHFAVHCDRESAVVLVVDTDHRSLKIHIVDTYIGTPQPHTP